MAFAEAEPLQEQETRRWHDALPSRLVAWLKRVSLQGSPPSVDEFREHFGRWTQDGQTVLHPELVIREVLTRIRGETRDRENVERLVAELEEKHSLGSYPLLLSEARLAQAEAADLAKDSKATCVHARDAHQLANGNASAFRYAVVSHRAEELLRKHRQEPRAIAPPGSPAVTDWTRTEIRPGLVHLSNFHVGDIWVTWEINTEDVAYCYGGSRLVASGTKDEKVIQQLERLTVEESGTKNRMLNKIVALMERSGKAQSLPSGLLESRVGAARCLIRLRQVAEGRLAE